MFTGAEMKRAVCKNKDFRISMACHTDLECTPDHKSARRSLQARGGAYKEAHTSSLSRIHEIRGGCARVIKCFV